MIDIAYPDDPQPLTVTEAIDKVSWFVAQTISHKLRIIGFVDDAWTDVTALVTGEGAVCTDKLLPTHLTDPNHYRLLKGFDSFIKAEEYYQRQYDAY